MKKRTYIFSILLISVSSVFSKTELDTTKLTFPQALGNLKEKVDFTYSLPRIYRNEGAKGHTNYSLKEPEKTLELVLQQYMRIHGLNYTKDNNHYHFKRNPYLSVVSPYTFESPTLLEALGSLDRYLQREEIDFENWRLQKTELKWEKSNDYQGAYWHLIFSRKNGVTDGGIGTYHFFIYNDLLVEHKADGRGIAIKMQTSQEVIDSTTNPHY